jgi:putative transposase
MGDSKKVQVRLSKPEQHQLDDLLSGGLQPVRTVLRALVLRRLADGQAIRKVARNTGLTPKTVWLTSQRYQQGGLEGALYERALCPNFPGLAGDFALWPQSPET